MTATQRTEDARDVQTPVGGPVARGDVDARRSRSGFWTAVALTVAAALGFGTGWLVFGNDDTANGSEFPIGRFTGEANAGSVFEFDEDGTYEFCLSDGRCVSGVYGIRDDLYTEMTHDAAGFSKVPATYRWSFEDNALTFELVGQDVLSARNTTMSDRYVLVD